MHKQTEFVLSTSNDSSEVFMCPRNGLPHNTQFWVLDYRLDGTFLIICDTQKRLVLSCGSTISTSTESQLIMDQFNGDESQLWRFDGGHIESVKFNNRVMKVMKVIYLYRMHYTVEHVHTCMLVVGHLGISGTHSEVPYMYVHAFYTKASHFPEFK